MGVDRSILNLLVYLPFQPMSHNITLGMILGQISIAIEAASVALPDPSLVIRPTIVSRRFLFFRSACLSGIN